MSFLQIIDFHTDRIEEFIALEHQWEADSAGARTSTGGQLYADRDNPGHYVALDWFTDYDSAMVNSHLPATSAFAEQAMALSRGEVVFHNLEPAMEVFIQGEPELRQSLVTSELVQHAFTDDVVLDMIVPHGRVVTRGVDALAAALREETPARRVELWEPQPTPTGFVAEYAYRTLDDTLAVGTIIAKVHEGRIARLFLTCGGNWDAETQRQVHESTGELVGSGVMTAVDADPATVSGTAIEEGGALMERLFGALLGSVELATVHLGSRLGLYAALDHPRTAGELAAETGIDERYAREWLEQQAISGLVEVAEPGDTTTRRYVTSPGQEMALVDSESPVYAVPMSLLLGGLGTALPRLPEVYRTGTGISFGEYGDDVRLGQGLFNRGPFLEELTQEWVPAMPEVARLLGREGAAAVDLGCGVGWSSIALARAFPGLSVLGVDSDDASIMDARAHAAQAGISDRVRFEVTDADADLGEGSHDVAFFFEALHDMAHPVEALVAARRSLRHGGRVVVMDERAEEEFAPGGSPIERLLAASSVLHCLPVSRSQPDSAATGALFRPHMVRHYAEHAGYAEVEVAPIEHDLFRFYVLTP